MTAPTVEELRLAAAELVSEAGYADDHPVVQMLHAKANAADAAAKAPALPSGWYVFTAEDLTSISGDHSTDPEWYDNPTEADLEEMAGLVASNFFSWGYRRTDENGNDIDDEDGAG